MNQSDLIARLEAATEGSRELDAEIWWFAHGPLPRFAESLEEAIVAAKVGRIAGSKHARVLRYTTSIDAALTLVPTGWYTMHAGQNPMSGTWYWGIGCNAGLIDESAHDADSDHQTKSGALALCIAALKAQTEDQ